MTRYKYFVAGLVVLAMAAGYAAWQSDMTHPARLTERTGTPPGPAAVTWYMSSGKFASCVESSGPDQKIEEVRNTGEDPTIVDDDHGTIQVMREGPPEQWAYFKTKALCDAYNEAGRKGAVKSREP